MIVNHYSFQYEVFDVAAKFEGYYAVGADARGFLTSCIYTSVATRKS